MELSALKVAGLYAGIGGFELAFRQAGAVPVFLADSWDPAQRVLKSKFPEAELAGDVAEIDELPNGIDVVTAGFPCQNLSMAGDKTGITGKKSGDVRHLFDLIEISKPGVILIENVYFMLHLDRGAAMEHLISEFERLGYRWAYRLIDTLAFGLPQRRRRIYFVASKDIDPRDVLFRDTGEEHKVAAPTIERPIGFYWTEGRSGAGLTADGVPPIKGGSGIGIPSAPAVLFPDGQVLMPDIESCEALQGFPRKWTEAAAEDKRSKRWVLVGNAVSVPAAGWVAKRIVNSSTSFEPTGRASVLGSKWPNAACGDRHGRYSVEASASPLINAAPSISEYRTPAWTPLSLRALTGFVKRAREGNLRYPAGFLDSLDAAIVEAAQRA